MSTALSSHQRFLVNALYVRPPRISRTVAVSCSKPVPHKEDEHPVEEPMKVNHGLAKLAMVSLAAGVLTLGSVHDASAANSGGRVGGQAFRSSGPRYSSPRINNSRRNIYVNPPVAPPLVGGGYGFGFGSPFYGGWGWSPFSFFVPGPSVAVGIGGGFDFFIFFLVLGAAGAVFRRFFGPKDEEDDY